MVASGLMTMPQQEYDATCEHYQRRQAHPGTQQIRDDDFDLLIGPVRLFKH
jgi:hypothetical protein